MRFESEEDLRRERKAIETFVKVFKGSYKKLGPDDIDYRVFDKDNKLISYVEVKGRLRTISQAYPLPVALQKIVKLSAKRLNPVMIWACEDGIMYGKVKDIYGTVSWMGTTELNSELVVHSPKQKTFKYARYY